MNRADLRARLAQLETLRAGLEAHRLSQLETRCAGYPDPVEAEGKLHRLERLLSLREALGLELALLCPARDSWEPPAVFGDQDPEEALRGARLEYGIWQEDSRVRPFPWYWLVLMAAGLAAVSLLPRWIGKALGAAAILVGTVLFASAQSHRKRTAATVRALEARYAPVPPEQWVSAAQEYAARLEAREAAWQAHLPERTALEEQLAALDRELSCLCAGNSPENLRQTLLGMLSDLADLAQARRECGRLPHSPIQRNLSLEETQSQLTAVQAEIRRLRQLLASDG